ncbi:hypothetical protein YERSI8AC_210053 [Enterobacterales bacterium 8AC]|nr:hypothetical protein YERSI8AC_210053 [Enterobacterales bacterium 8AC]
MAIDALVFDYRAFKGSQDTYLAFPYGHSSSAKIGSALCHKKTLLMSKH